MIYPATHMQSVQVHFVASSQKKITFSKTISMMKSTLESGRKTYPYANFVSKK